MSDIFPIRCFTCGEYISQKYPTFKQLLSQKFELENINIKYFLYDENRSFTIRDILDQIQIVNVCCRKHFITFMSRTDVEAYLSE